MNDGDFLPSGDPTETYGAVPHGSPRPPMIDLRGHDGRFLALPYARLTGIELDHDAVIRLDFPERRILLRGRNLRPLDDALVQHRVTYVQEGDLDVLSEAETFIDNIVIAPTAPEPQVAPEALG